MAFADLVSKVNWIVTLALGAAFWILLEAERHLERSWSAVAPAPQGVAPTLPSILRRPGARVVVSLLLVSLLALALALEPPRSATQAAWTAVLIMVVPMAVAATYAWRSGSPGAALLRVVVMTAGLMASAVAIYSATR